MSTADVRATQPAGGAVTFAELPFFALSQAVALNDFYQKQVLACDIEIERVLQGPNRSAPTPEAPLPKARHRTRQPNALDFDVRQTLYDLVGVDLTQIHDVGPYLALRLVAECGTDMRRWASAKHFTSWLTLSPDSKVSGGKILSSHTQRSPTG